MSGIKTPCGEDLYADLKRGILCLELAPGQLISENEISRKYNVSRTPVKAAFLRLMSEGFIDIKPQKGSYVTLLDLERIKAIINMRIILETDTVLSVIKDIPARVLKTLRDCLKNQETLVSSKDIDPTVFYALDSHFHSVLFDYAGRSKMWEIIQEFQIYYTRFRMLDIVATRSFESIIAEHRDIYGAIREENRDLFAKLLSTHLYGNINRLAGRIEKELRHYFL